MEKTMTKTAALAIIVQHKCQLHSSIQTKSDWSKKMTSNAFLIFPVKANKLSLLMNRRFCHSKQKTGEGTMSWLTLRRKHNDRMIATTFLWYQDDNSDAITVTPLLWLWLHDYDCDCMAVTVTAWLWLHDYDCVTMTAWLWLHDYDCMTMTAWLWLHDYDCMTLTDMRGRGFESRQVLGFFFSSLILKVGCPQLGPSCRCNTTDFPINYA